MRLQHEVRGEAFDDIVPRGVLAVAANTGGILVGAFDAAGRHLKLAQRERALSRGFELIEWTYAPLIAGNAHLKRPPSRRHGATHWRAVGVAVVRV